MDHVLYFDEDDIRIVWSFMLAGVHDNHSAQDNLSEKDHQRAEEIYNELLKMVEENAGKKHGREATHPDQ